MELSSSTIWTQLVLEVKVTEQLGIIATSREEAEPTFRILRAKKQKSNSRPHHC